MPGRPPHLSKEYLPGIHHQAWSPNDDYYQRPWGMGGGSVIEYTINSLATATTGPYVGLVVATVTVRGAPCESSDIIGTVIEVVDHSGCIFDVDPMTGYTGWASEMVFLSLDPLVECGILTPCHWAAINRCCSAGSGTYAEGCP